MKVEYIVFLILFPFLTAAILAFAKNNTARKLIVYISSTIIILVASVFALGHFVSGTAPCKYFEPSHLTHNINYVMMAVELFLMVIVLRLSFKYKKYHTAVLSVLGTLPILWLELTGRAETINSYMYCDKLAVVMCTIIAVVGGMICIYAVGYMNDFHHHHTEHKDRRTFFFPMLFVFLGAMFGLVTSSNLIWVYFFWEITSISSFLLIGYTRTKEAINNSFTALWMNLLGGLAFAIAIIVCAIELGVFNLQHLKINTVTPLKVIPIILFAFAALTKSAQLPFSKWLLGAMVAPTPTSALLHSATMVKAGVYLLLRLAPAMHGNMAGNMVSLIGALTFLVASMLAVTVSDGKKVLAYSTISNLGLITACAGAGTEETVWAGILLLMFHAVSKSMMFQAVGAIENSTGSRDIEDMHGLIIRLPFLAIVMVIGICAMFLAPFGMLVSKWAALKAFVENENIILILCIAFGSAVTMFYWTKWLAKILSFKANTRLRQNTTSRAQWLSLIGHLVTILGLCVSLPIFTVYVVEPLLAELFKVIEVKLLSTEDMVIMVIMLVLIFIVPVISGILARRVRAKKSMEYMAGINEGDNRRFTGSFNEPKMMFLSNWYMVDYFGEKKIWKLSLAVTTAIIVVCIGLAIGNLPGGGI